MSYSTVTVERISSYKLVNKSPKSEPALELHSRAAPSVEAHQHVSGPNTGRNSGGRRIKKDPKKYGRSSDESDIRGSGIWIPIVHAKATFV